jgi:hypothetical protein
MRARARARVCVCVCVALHALAVDLTSSSSSIGTTTLVGSRPAQLSLSILSRKVLQSAVANGTSNPNLEENQGFRAFHLSPQEAPSVWSDASEPSSGRWNYGQEMAENVCPKVATSTSLLGYFTWTDGFTSPPKKGVLRIFFARKIRRLRPGLNPRTRVPKASTLPLDHRSRSIDFTL